MTEAEQVQALRSRGADVCFNAKAPGTASVHVQTRNLNYISIAHVTEVLNLLHMKAALGDINAADRLLLTVLEDSNII